MINRKFIALVLTLGFAAAPITAKADLLNPESTKKADSPEQTALKAARKELEVAQKQYKDAVWRRQIVNREQENQWKARLNACNAKVAAAQKAAAAVKRAEAQAAAEAEVAARNAKNAKALEAEAEKKAGAKADAK